MNDNKGAEMAGHDVHHKLSFFRKYIWSTDHKVIAKQFLFSSLFFFVVGGLLALGVRWQLAYPGESMPFGYLLPDSMVQTIVNEETGQTQYLLLPEGYNNLFTMHASIMIFFVIIPLLAGFFANFLIPLQIGYRDMAFPTLNAISYWLFWPAGIIVLSSFWAEGGPAGAGWTSYPPLAATLPGNGTNLWLIGVGLVGMSSVVGGMNYVTTILNLRAPGMSMLRLPLSIWSLFITAILQVLATPILTAGVIMLFFDRVLGTSFFLPKGLMIGGTLLEKGAGGQPLLFQHIFWFYSHPAVYVMILPAMGIVSDIISTFARKPIFGYKAMVFSLISISGLGFIVWGHHMFQSGMNPVLGTTFMISTMVIAVPSSVKTFNWLGTLWGASIWFTTPMCFAIAFVAHFIIGGLSGIFMASTPVDIFIHDTYFIVAHIHYVVFTGSVMAIFAGIYFWFPKIFGRLMNERWGKVHFWLTFISMNGVFFPMHMAGAGGMMRRIYDPTFYEFLQPLQPLNVFMTISSIVLGIAQIPFFINFFYSLYRGKVSDKNPWRANTLEWICPSPPGHGNFDTIPTVYRGPHEYSSPQVEEDWLLQSRNLEEVPAGGDGGK